jgi:hypothetical protein
VMNAVMSRLMRVVPTSPPNVGKARNRTPARAKSVP